MKFRPFFCAATLLVLVTASSVSAQSSGGTGNQGNNNMGSAMCPITLLAEFNDNYFYQVKNCQSGTLLADAQRFMSKVKTGCSGGTACQCTEQQSGSTQTKYADPDAKIFVPFGGGASSHQGPSKLVVQAGTKKFVLISMRFKGAKTTSGAADNELDVVVQFGQEVDPGVTIPTGNNTATLTGNSLSFGGQTYTVTLMGSSSAQTP